MRKTGILALAAAFAAVINMSCGRTGGRTGGINQLAGVPERTLPADTQPIDTVIIIYQVNGDTCWRWADRGGKKKSRRRRVRLLARRIGGHGAALDTVIEADSSQLAALPSRRDTFWMNGRPYMIREVYECGAGIADSTVEPD